MIRRNAKYLVMSALIAFAANANAGAGAIPPALAACSKALIATLTSADKAPAYTVKSPSSFVSDLVDPNAFTVLAHNTRTKQLLAKASCKATPDGEIVSFRSIPVKS
jgi:hypothetical protein